MNKKTDILQPPKLGNNIIIISLATYILASLIRDFYFDFAFDLSDFSDLERKLEWYLKVARDIGQFVAISSMIIFGIRSIRIYGRKIKRLIISALGLLFCTALAIGGLFGGGAVSELQSVSDESIVLEKLEVEMKKETLTLEKKSALSKLYASNYYNKHGKKIEYLLPDGNHIDFMPTKKDKEFRAKKLKATHSIKWSQKTIGSSRFFWLLTLVITLLIGFFTPVGKQNRHSG